MSASAPLASAAASTCDPPAFPCPPGATVVHIPTFDYVKHGMPRLNSTSWGINARSFASANSLSSLRKKARGFKLVKYNSKGTYVVDASKQHVLIHVGARGEVFQNEQLLPLLQALDKDVGTKGSNEASNRSAKGAYHSSREYGISVPMGSQLVESVDSHGNPIQRQEVKPRELTQANKAFKHFCRQRPVKTMNNNLDRMLARVFPIRHRWLCRLRAWCARAARAQKGGTAMLEHNPFCLGPQTVMSLNIPIGGNQGVFTAPHVDGSNSPHNPCFVLVLGSFCWFLRYWLVFYDLEIIVELPPGVCIAFPSSMLIHGNAHLLDFYSIDELTELLGSTYTEAFRIVEKNGKTKYENDIGKEKRVSAVLYTQANLVRSLLKYKLGEDRMRELAVELAEINQDDKTLIAAIQEASS